MENSLGTVSKTITVKADAARAYEAFTRGIDRWWPRTHHIGNAPLGKVIVEEAAGGRCYSEQTDGTECDWGRVLVWDPPHRFVMAWQVTPEWKYEADLAHSSEVEVRFTAEPDGATRVDLLHRYLERHGPGAELMHQAVDSPGGWSGMLQLYRTTVSNP